MTTDDDSPCEALFIVRVSKRQVSKCCEIYRTFRETDALTYLLTYLLNEVRKVRTSQWFVPYSKILPVL